MKLIASFDTAKDGDEPRIRVTVPMTKPLYWYVKLWGHCADEQIRQAELRPTKKCSYRDLLKLLLAQMEEMREEGGGLKQFMFWVYKAR